MLALNRIMSMQRDTATGSGVAGKSEPGAGLIASSTGKRKRSPCEQDGDSDSQAGKIMRSTPDLPEQRLDILSRIHFLLPMREAARAACLSHAFLRPWRCHPNLIFNKDTIGLKKTYGENFHHKIDRILRNHSGISLKSFEVDYAGTCRFDGTSYFDSWLQIAVKPGIEELTLWLGETRRIYNFPCSVLSDGVQNSLRHLKIRCCALHPTAELGPFRSLTSLCLCRVNIKSEELECLLSNSLGLEHLDLTHCMEIICLKIPCTLQQLTRLDIFECSSLKVLESKAPNLSSFFHRGFRLPSTMPNLETIVIESGHEVVDAPTLPSKFLYLKHLRIRLISVSDISRPYDYFSLVSFLEASPSLETLILDVTALRMAHESIFADSELRDMPEHRHGCLKSVTICGFSSAKILVELTCYILKNAVSLECLTLDTIYGPRCYQQDNKFERCIPMADGVLMETPRARVAIRTYIENKVPPTVKLTVLEPCNQCHATGKWRMLSQPGDSISLSF
ncbi:unnamed protein product [Urochloa decumbens]|uniref:At1g61320/AtMIF1 LRR domain-containing protein n=1 Tax=Urochloa decumbens TaxID=240449 RepID=A0ABC9BNF7_9POAL